MTYDLLNKRTARWPRMRPLCALCAFADVFRYVYTFSLFHSWPFVACIRSEAAYSLRLIRLIRIVHNLAGSACKWPRITIRQPMHGSRRCAYMTCWCGLAKYLLCSDFLRFNQIRVRSSNKHMQTCKVLPRGHCAHHVQPIKLATPFRWHGTHATGVKNHTHTRACAHRFEMNNTVHVDGFWVRAVCRAANVFPSQHDRYVQ